jgi:purine catabolism regulator
VVAGEAGCDRLVQRLNIMEVPDILPWVKPHELLLTTGYPLRDSPRALVDLVSALDERGVAAMGIKLHRYFDELPPEMIARADEIGFPIIVLLEGVGFDEIMNQVLTDILNRQAALLARSEELHRALVQIVLAGGGLQEVSEKLVDLLGGAVVVVGADGRELAASGAAQQLAALRQSPWSESDTRLGAEVSQTLDGGDGNSVAIVRVVAGLSDHGRIIALARDRKFQDGDIHALERAATVAALVITKGLAVTAVESKYRADFVRDLFDGRVSSSYVAVPHAATFGWDLDRPLVAVVSELDPPLRDAAGHQRVVLERLTNAWSTAVRLHDPRAVVVEFAHEVIVLLGAPEGADAVALARQLARQVAADMPQHRAFSTGISRVAGSVAQLPLAYEHARKAVAIGRRLNGASGVMHFDGLGVFRLLSQISDTRELEEFVQETLGDLADLDDPEKADLRRTLQVLLDANMNVAEASRLLHFHYNTLRYRIGKLEKMLGPFTQDATLRLNLMLALQVLSMRGMGSSDARRVR